MANKTVTIGCGILLVLGIIYLPGLIKLRSLAVRNAELEKGLRQLQEQNAALQEEKLRLEKDLTYVEKIVREKLGLSKEGEKIYRVIPEEK